MEISVRPAVVDDVPGLARVHVESWRETYRGQMPDSVLDDPEFIGRRERFWTFVLTDDESRTVRRAAAATLEGEVVGVALSGPPEDEDADWDAQLYVLYTYASIQGRGAGARLLDAVIDPAASAALWVADPNPRAQAFYRKQGFAFDGTSQVDDGVREVRMIRPARPAG
jgi:ribosomal protein S18 acetylase RimI-like enzyme